MYAHGEIDTTRLTTFRYKSEYEAVKAKQIREQNVQKNFAWKGWVQEMEDLGGLL